LFTNKNIGKSEYKKRLRNVDMEKEGGRESKSDKLKHWKPPIEIEIVYNNTGINRLLSTGPPCFATQVLFKRG
jgi:hypothetical protein